MRFVRLRAFLRAEEVPRWFGLSIVLIYLVGIASVSRLGIVQARQECQAYYDSSSQYAVESLLVRLRAIAGSESDTARRAISYRLAMREFATSVPTRMSRLLDESGQVLVSVPYKGTEMTAEVAAFAEINDAQLHLEQRAGLGTTDSERVYRVRVHPWEKNKAPSVADAPETAGLADGAPANQAAIQPATRTAAQGADAPLFLEVILPASYAGPTSLADQHSLTLIVFVVLGALFVVYRCLREQLRGVSRIAQRLESRKEQVEDDLSALRIADSTDQAVESWNELIDLIVKSQSVEQRTAADVELSRVLAKSSGGALAEALHAIPDAIVYLSNETRIEYANSAACRFFEWDVRSIRGESISDSHRQGAPGTALEAIHKSMQDDGTFSALSDVIEFSDNDRTDTSTFRIWVIPLERAHHDGECVVVIRDVSQQVRADKAREELVTQVTHELRTPLTNIRAYTETLASGMFDDPNTISECYNVITKETRRLSRLIEDILSISQIEVGGIDLNVDQVDLRALLTEAVRDVRGLADAKNIDLQVVLPSKLEPIRGDRDKLAVVVNNLLGNAIKYTPKQGNVIVGCQVSPTEVLLTIKDNGIGIAPEEHAQVFDKFYRAANAESQGETGTGIGLYTAREIARRHGGDIELISAQDQGSTFMVRLPHEGSRALSLGTGGV